MDMRQLKALEIAARLRLNYVNGAWHVPSQSGRDTYRVVLSEDGHRCSCQDWTLPRADGKHIIAAQLVAQRDGIGDRPALDTDRVPKRPTYPQNWSVYNLAQTTEKHRFQELLFDLCQSLSPSARRPTRRQPLPPADIVFASAF